METTYTTAQVAEQINVPYRTLMYWIQQGLINPAYEQGERRKKIRFSEKDLREATILADLRKNRLTLQELRENLDYLRSIGHNPLSRGVFGVAKKPGQRAHLDKFMDGQRLEVSPKRGQLELPLFDEPDGQVTLW